MQTCRRRLSWLLFVPLVGVSCGPQAKEAREKKAPPQEKIHLDPLEAPDMQGVAIAAADCQFQQTFVDGFLSKHSPSFHRKGGTCARIEQGAAVALPEWDLGPKCKAESCWLYTFAVAKDGLEVPMFGTLNSRGGGSMSPYDSSGFILFVSVNHDTSLYESIARKWDDRNMPLMAITYRSMLRKMAAEATAPVSASDPVPDEP